MVVGAGLIIFGAFTAGKKSTSGPPSNPPGVGGGSTNAVQQTQPKGQSMANLPPGSGGSTGGTGTITAAPGSALAIGNQLHVHIGKDGTVTTGTNTPSGGPQTPATGRFTADGLFVFSLEDGTGEVEPFPNEHEFWGLLNYTGTNTTKWATIPERAPDFAVTPQNIGFSVQFSRGDVEDPTNWTPWYKLSPTGPDVDIPGKPTAYRLQHTNSVAAARIHLLFKKRS
ncbi:MAG: hypothetical protein HYW65_01640 [Candidatus Liptonbacteria bacterium]|nr:hypothetical protein [Candidatus Liptonbacteria bacterium]